MPKSNPRATPGAYQFLAAHEVHPKVMELAFFPDGTRVASRSRIGSVHVWNVFTGTTFWHTRPGKESVTAIAPFPDGSLLVGAVEDRLVSWEAISGARLAEVELDAKIEKIHLLPDKLHVLVAVQENATQLRLQTVRLDSGAVVHVHEPLTAHTNKILAMDDHHVLSTNYHKRGFFWDLQQARPVHTLPERYKCQRGAFCGPETAEQPVLATSSDKKLRVWDARSGERRDRLTGHKDAIRAVALAPDGQFVASGGFDKRAHVWDLAHGQRQRLKGHAEYVMVARFSPDSQLLVMCEAGPRTLVWERAAAVPARTRAIRYWETELVNAPTALGRVLAARCLGQFADPASRALLEENREFEADTGVQAAIRAALKRMPPEP